MFIKGQTIEQFIGSQTGAMFDIVDSKGILFVIVDDTHIEQFKLGGHYEFWCTSYNETLFLAVKLGDNSWMSAPYTPHLSSNYSLAKFPKKTGMPLTVVLLSNVDGVIKDVDFMVLGNEFSNTLRVLCDDIMDKPFNFQRHQLTIQAVYNKFSTDDELVMQPGVTYSLD